MGCKPSSPQIQSNGDLFNEDSDIRKRFLTGVHVSKGASGIEGNIQLAFGTTRKKKYERVATIPPSPPENVEQQELASPSDT